MKKGRRIAWGNTAEVFDWGADHVLKLYQEGLPASLCQNEFDKTMGVYHLIKMAPKPVKIIYDHGRIGAVYQKVHGRTLLQQMMSKPWLFRKYARNLAIYHVDMQKPVDFELPTVKQKLKRDIEAVALLTDTEKQYLYHYLDGLPDGNTLCHFDFHPDNIILSDNHYAIIDWMTACEGEKLSDIARTGIILRFSEIPKAPKVVRFVLGIFQRQMPKIYQKEYRKITNASACDIEKWEVPIAAARLREWIPEKERQQLLAFVRRNLERQCIKAFD